MTEQLNLAYVRAPGSNINNTWDDAGLHQGYTEQTINSCAVCWCLKVTPVLIELIWFLEVPHA